MHTSQGIYKQLSKILQRYFTLEENDFWSIIKFFNLGKNSINHNTLLRRAIPLLRGFKGEFVLLFTPFTRIWEQQGLVVALRVVFKEATASCTRSISFFWFSSYKCVSFSNYYTTELWFFLRIRFLTLKMHEDPLIVFSSLLYWGSDSFFSCLSQGGALWELWPSESLHNLGM